MNKSYLSHTFLCPQPHFPWFDEVSFGATRDFVIQDKGNESQKWVERPARRPDVGWNPGWLGVGRKMLRESREKLDLG